MEFKVPWKCPSSGKATRHFRLTLADLVEASEHFETPTVTELWKRLASLRYEDMPWMMWLGLRHEEPDLTPEKVASWEFSVWPAREVLMDAWCRTMNGITAAEQAKQLEKMEAERKANGADAEPAREEAPERLDPLADSDSTAA